jgi:hypothetical protein
MAGTVLRKAKIAPRSASLICARVSQGMAVFWAGVTTGS